MRIKDLSCVVAITGASGVIYAQHLLKAMAREGCQIELVMTDTARVVIAHELGMQLPKELDKAKTVIREQLLRDASYPYLRLHDVDDFTASLASGSVPQRGMVIIPCSMGTLSRIAQGNANNLIERAADVTLKEKRPLIVAPRETPLNYIHLRNMLELSKAGAHIIPCMPAFYYRPQKIEDLANFMAGKIFDALGIEHSLYKRWEKPRAS